MTTQCITPETPTLHATARRMCTVALPTVALPTLAPAAGRTRRILAAAWAGYRRNWRRAAAMDYEVERLREQARRLYHEQSGGRM